MTFKPRRLHSHRGAILQLGAHRLEIGIHVVHADSRFVLGELRQLLAAAGLRSHSLVFMLAFPSLPDTRPWPFEMRGCGRACCRSRRPGCSTPASSSGTTPATICSGVSSYTTFIFTSFGCPALGCTIIGRPVTARYRSTACERALHVHAGAAIQRHDIGALLFHEFRRALRVDPHHGAEGGAVQRHVVRHRADDARRARLLRRRDPQPSSSSEVCVSMMIASAPASTSAAACSSKAVAHVRFGENRRRAPSSRRTARCRRSRTPRARRTPPARSPPPRD